MAKVVYIMGKSSTGKDTAFKKLMEQKEIPFERIPLYTTRPIREGEHEGVEYHFTDLSTFFLNNAKLNFKDYDFLKYGIFDINKDFSEQGYDAFSFDVILCANVLHNAKNIHWVLDNLKNMLVDGGIMTVLEETRVSYILLTSMEFKDGLTGFEDERAIEDQTFFTRTQWENNFAGAGGNIVFE